jgi:hypothetical protein
MEVVKARRPNAWFYAACHVLIAARADGAAE